MRRNGVDIKPSYDVWSSGMTLLAAADITESPSTYEDPRLFVVNDIATEPTRAPNWDNIDAARVMNGYGKLFKVILEEDESRRVSAEEVISILC